MNFLYRTTTLNDIKAICILSEKTFRDTYSEFNTPENMEEHVARNFSNNQIEKELQSTDCQYFVIESDAEIVAFAKLQKDHPTEGLEEKKVVEIERFYVNKNQQGQQLGRKLMEYCVEWANENNFETIWLGVWENNTNAIKFYQKMGFEFLSKHTFVLGTEVQTDFTMKKQLR